MNLDSYKYSKYKTKYLELKKQKGGFSNKCFNGLIDCEMLNFYLSSNEINSFDMIKLGAKMNQDDKKVKVLVGATNDVNLDYLRFVKYKENQYEYDNITDPLHIYTERAEIIKGIDIFDFYIDIDYNIERQNDMFVVKYDDIHQELVKLNYESIPKPKPFIDEIIFDTGVSYFTDINYLDIANYYLKNGGKMIWRLEQHQGETYRKNGNRYRGEINNETLTQEELENRHGISIKPNKYTIDINMINYIRPRDGEDLKSNIRMTPQLGLSIRDENNIKYTYDYTEFATWIRDRYTVLGYPIFNVEIIEDNLFEKPPLVPFRITNLETLDFDTYNELQNFIFNRIFNKKIRQQLMKRNYDKEENLDKTLIRQQNLCNMLYLKYNNTNIGNYMVETLKNNIELYNEYINMIKNNIHQDKYFMIIPMNQQNLKIHNIHWVMKLTAGQNMCITKII